MSKKPAQTAIIPIDKNHVGEIGIEFNLRINLPDGATETIHEILNSDSSRFCDLFPLAGLDKTKDFIGMDMQGTKFIDEGVFLENSNMRGCNLRQTTWKNTSVNGVLFEGANLTGVIGLTEENLASAYIDETTILPNHLNRQKIMFLHASNGLPPAPPIEPIIPEEPIVFEIPMTIHKIM